MMTRAQGIGAALLSVIVASVGCSSSKSEDDQPGAGGTAGTAVGGSAGRGSGGTAGRASGGSAGRASGGTAGNAGHAGNGDIGESGQGGGGGESGGDPCAACPSDMCLPSGECVDCLPTNDKCPSGKYCTGDSNTCVPGCKDADSCASGVCGATHDCQNCVADTECSDGKVCGNNVCAPPCSEAQEGANPGCGTGLTCCSLHCIDQNSDSAHCGACATSCGATSFCGTAACSTSVLAHVCKVGKIAVVVDMSDSDNDAARSIGNALVATCAPAPTQREISQDSTDVTGVANASTGHPVSGGDELLVVAGGFFFARVMSFTETAAVAPLHAHSEGGTDSYLDGAGTVIASFPGTENTSEYYFVVQFMRDPSSGSLVLNVQGFWQAATTIGAAYFNEQLLPNLDTLTKSWYVYKWTDANADHLAQPAEISLVNSGP